MPKNSLLLKVLYVEMRVDEKGAARVLEESTNSYLNIFCAFTVVTNSFIALEFTESTLFDIIFIKKDMETLNAVNFLHILRNIGSPTDIVLLVESDDQISEAEAREQGFAGILRKDYQASQLCEIITNLVSTPAMSHLEELTSASKCAK